MPFPFSLLCLLPLGMLNIDAEKLHDDCLPVLLSTLSFNCGQFFFASVSLMLLSLYVNKALLECTALLGDKIEISLQNFAIEQRISGIAFCLNIFFISRSSIVSSIRVSRGSSATCVSFRSRPYVYPDIFKSAIFFS